MITKKDISKRITVLTNRITYNQNRVEAYKIKIATLETQIKTDASELQEFNQMYESQK